MKYFTSSSLNSVCCADAHSDLNIRCAFLSDVVPFRHCLSILSGEVVLKFTCIKGDLRDIRSTLMAVRDFDANLSFMG